MIVTVMVTANSRNTRPTMPPINSTGMNTAIKREGDRDDGEADFARTLERRLEWPHAVFDVADDVLQHDDRVVDHEADRQGQRQQRHVVDREAERVHRRAGRDKRDRHRERRNDGRGRGAQEQEDHQHDQPDGDRSVTCTSSTESRIDTERSARISILTEAGIWAR